MGLTAATVYDFGVYMGLASFHASYAQIHKNNSTDNTIGYSRCIHELSNAQPLVHTLFSQNITFNWSLDDQLTSYMGNVFPNATNPMHEGMVALRQKIEDDIRSHQNTFGNAYRNTVANVYRLGLIIAMAEGQTTVNSGKASDLAHDGLLQAQQLIKNTLSMVPFNASLMANAITLTQNFSAGVTNTHNAVQGMRVNYKDSILTSNIA